MAAQQGTATVEPENFVMRPEFERAIDGVTHRVEGVSTQLTIHAKESAERDAKTQGVLGRLEAEMARLVHSATTAEQARVTTGHQETMLRRIVPWVITGLLGFGGGFAGAKFTGGTPAETRDNVERSTEKGAK